MIHITLTEIVTSTLLYTIVHGLLWIGRNAEKLMARMIVTETHRITHKHVKEKHQSTLRDCTESACGELVSVVSVDMA